MPWPPPAQRVLLVAAALLLSAVWAAHLRGPRTAAVAVPDDPRLDVRIDLNRAGAPELEALPGIGPALASRIVAWRAERGPFRSVDDLRDVPGVGARRAEALRPFVEVSPAP